MRWDVDFTCLDSKKSANVVNILIWLYAGENGAPWHVTSNCGQNHAFVCNIEMGRRVQTLSTTPRREFVRDS